MFNEFKKNTKIFIESFTTIILNILDINVDIINRINSSIKLVIEKLLTLLRNYMYLTVASVVLIIIILGSFGLINWKRDFGVADLINISLALLTFTAVKYTRIAAESSEKANTLSKQSLEYTHQPKLMPLDTSIFLPISKINEEIGVHRVMDEFNSELKLVLTNVYEGNAYNVSAWLSVDNENLLVLEKGETPDLYHRFFSEEYQFFVSRSLTNGVMEARMISILNGPEEKMSYNYFYIHKESRDSVPLLKSGENINIYVPSHVSVILHHLVYNPDLIDVFPPEDNIKLHVKYKTNDELDSDKFITKNYGLQIPRAHIISEQNSKNQPHILLEIKYIPLKEK